MPDFLSVDEADNLFALLQSMTGWQQDQIRVFGRIHPLPRLHRWFATSNERYRWSGIEMQPEPFSGALDYVLRRLESEGGVQFNTALGNFYRNGQDAVNWHSDDEPDLGPEPIIASLSLGATRRFLLRRKSDHMIRVSFNLTHGSLLWMSGTTQALWEHCVPKTARKVGSRINLTFRSIHQGANVSQRQP